MTISAIVAARLTATSTTGADWPMPRPRRWAPTSNAASASATSRRNRSPVPTMRVGGLADLFATVYNLFELRGLARASREHVSAAHLPARSGLRPRSSATPASAAVILVRAQGSHRGPGSGADAGLPMAKAATVTREAGLSGLEFGLAIPGTVGGILGTPAPTRRTSPAAWWRRSSRPMGRRRSAASLRSALGYRVGPPRGGAAAARAW
jgi:hypothetical protein